MLLNGFDTPTKLGIETNEKRGQIEEVKCENEYLSIDEEMAKRLGEVGRQRQVTLNTIMQCGWGILLSCYSGEDDVVFQQSLRADPRTSQG